MSCGALVHVGAVDSIALEAGVTGAAEAVGQIGAGGVVVTVVQIETTLVKEGRGDVGLPAIVGAVAVIAAVEITERPRLPQVDGEAHGEVVPTLFTEGEVAHVLVVIGLTRAIAIVFGVGDGVGPGPVGAIGIAPVGAIAHHGEDRLVLVIEGAAIGDALLVEATVDREPLAGAYVHHLWPLEPAPVDGVGFDGLAELIHAELEITALIAAIARSTTVLLVGAVHTVDLVVTPELLDDALAIVARAIIISALIEDAL